jgi:hypothetical protein
VKLSSWPEIGSDGDVLLTPNVPKGITGYDDDSLNQRIFKKILKNLIYIKFYVLGQSHLSTIPICLLLSACARPSISIFIQTILIKIKH